MREVRVEGCAHVDPVIVRQSIHIETGMVLDRAAVRLIQSDIRSLMDTGQFADVQVEREDILEDGNVVAVRLVYAILEKPVIVEVRFLGNDAYGQRRLRRELGLGDGELVFYDENVKRDLISTMRDFYRSKSYPDASVQIETETTELEDELLMTVTLNEGSKLPVRKITFNGNTAYTDRELKKFMETKRSWWIVITNEYDESVLNRDLLALRFAYRDKGYLDAKVTAGELITTDKGITVPIEIQEGLPYTVRTVSIEGNSVFTDADALEDLKLISGDIYSETVLSTDKQRILYLYQDQGYFFTRVAADLKPDADKHEVDMLYRVSESRRLRLGELQIQGVVTTEAGETFPTTEDEFSTKDFVIEREVKLQPGEALDWSKVRIADRKLTNLGYFKSETYPKPDRLNLVPGFSDPIPRLDDPTVADLLLRLEEVETGVLTFGGGFSTTFGPSAIISLEKRNFLGRGLDGTSMFEVGSKRSRIMLDVAEPHLFGSDWYASTRMFWSDREAIGGRTFDEERVGTGVTFGHTIWDEHTKGYAGFKVEQTDISEFAGGRLEVADLPEEFQEGKNSTASVTLSAVRDSRDFIVNPTQGTVNRLSLEMAALADNEFVKVEAGTKWFRRLFEKAIFEVGGRVQLAHPFGSNDYLPLQERFFVGGQNSVRGFEYGGIGRGDVVARRIFLGGRGLYEDVDEFTVGGEAAVVGSIELRYPLWDFLYGAIFMDTGASYPEIGDFDPSDLRASIGTGIRANLPIGAVARIDFAYPFLEEEHDSIEHVQFTFSQSLGR